jgi:hypothetical protein
MKQNDFSDAHISVMKDIYDDKKYFEKNEIEYDEDGEAYDEEYFPEFTLEFRKGRWHLLDTFESYLYQIFNNLELSDFIPNVWFNFRTQQKDWVTYELNGSIKKAAHILRLEYINDDIKPLQDYFMNGRNLDIFDPNLDYRDYYNKRSIDLVANVFKDDIEMFDYKF